MSNPMLALRHKVIEWLKQTQLPGEAERVYERARRVVRERLGDRGRIWAAIGLDQARCLMGCKFCSFAFPSIAPEQYREVSHDEALRWADHFIRGGAEYLILRSSEQYPLERLVELGRMIRRAKPAEVRLLANTGLATCSELGDLVSAGFYGIYKTIRLREGIDTPFSAAERIEQIRQARRVGLRAFALVEPIGPEHTDEEIADAIMTLRNDVQTVLVGGMARVPVEGSPLAHHGMIDAQRLAGVTAAFVLAMEDCFDNVEIVCSHPAQLEVLRAGANAVVVEVGAIPRDNAFAQAEWRGLTIAEARNLLGQAGYRD